MASAYADEHARGRAIGLVYGIGAVGAAAGPFIGGILTEQLGWEWVFFFNVPIATGALLLGLAGIPDSRDETAPRHVDVVGVVLVTTGLVAISYAFDRGGGVGINRAYVVVTLAGWIANSGFVIAIFCSTLFLQQVRDLSPVEAGLVFLAPPVALAFAGPLSGRLAERLRPEVIGGLAVVTGGAGLLVGSADLAVWASFVVGIGLMGLGFGLGWSYASVGTQAVVPPREAGAASGVTLTIVIRGAGVLLVVVATAIEELGGGQPTTGAPEDVLRVTAGGIVLALGRRARVGSARGEWS